MKNLSLNYIVLVLSVSLCSTLWLQAQCINRTDCLTPTVQMPDSISSSSAVLVISFPGNDIKLMKFRPRRTLVVTSYQLSKDSNFKEIFQFLNEYRVGLKDCNFKIDSAISLRFIVSSLLPNTTYYYRAWASGGYFDGEFHDDFISHGKTSNIIRFTTASVSLPTIPALLHTRNIQQNSMTLRWNKSSGAPESYLFDIATDSLFKSLIPAYTGVMVRDTQISVTGLEAGVRYYYRVKAVNAQGQSAYSRTGNERTLTTGKKILTGEESDYWSMPLERTIYTQALPGVFTTMQADSMVKAVMDGGITPDSVWIQYNGDCAPGKTKGSAAIGITVRLGGDRMKNYGYKEGLAGWATDGYKEGSAGWEGDCSCRSYRLYYNNTPTSVEGVKMSKTLTLSCSPNPASEILHCRYEVNTASRIEISLTDMLGRELYRHEQGIKTSGLYERRIETTSLQEGMYILRLRAGVEIVSMKVVVVR